MTATDAPPADDPEFPAEQLCPVCGGTAARSPTVVRCGRSMGTAYACGRCGAVQGAVFPHDDDPPGTHAFVRRKVANLVAGKPFTPKEAAR